MTNHGNRSRIKRSHLFSWLTIDDGNRFQGAFVVIAPFLFVVQPTPFRHDPLVSQLRLSLVKTPANRAGLRFTGLPVLSFGLGRFRAQLLDLIFEVSIGFQNLMDAVLELENLVRFPLDGISETDGVTDTEGVTKGVGLEQFPLPGPWMAKLSTQTPS